MWTTILRNRNLRGRRIAVLAADGFEAIELTLPRWALRMAGAKVEVISLHRGKIRGMNLTEPAGKVRVDLALDEANPLHYDALLVPGGFIGPDFLRQSADARAFVRAVDEAKKPIASLCHGPWLLASAELVRGRRLTSWPGIRDDLVHAGAVWRDEPLVRDRNWVTSRGPQDLHAFIPGMLAAFETPASGDDSAVLLDEPPAITDGDSSPQYDTPAKVAVAAARMLPGPMLGTLAGAAAVTTLSALALRRAL